MGARRRDTAGRGVPGGRAARRVEPAHLLGTPQQHAHPVQVGGAAAERPGLHQDVAQGRGLGRAGYHRQPAGVSGELEQQFVAYSAADHVHGADRPAGQFLHLADGPAVGQGQAVQDAADRGGRIGRRPLPGPPGRLGDAGRHVAGREEGRVIGIHHDLERR